MNCDTRLHTDLILQAAPWYMNLATDGRLVEFHRFLLRFPWPDSRKFYKMPSKTGKK